MRKSSVALVFVGMMLALAVSITGPPVVSTMQAMTSYDPSTPSTSAGIGANDTGGAHEGVKASERMRLGNTNPGSYALSALLATLTLIASYALYLLTRRVGADSGTATQGQFRPLLEVAAGVAKRFVTLESFDTPLRAT